MVRKLLIFYYNVETNIPYYTQHPEAASPVKPRSSDAVRED